MCASFSCFALSNIEKKLKANVVWRSLSVSQYGSKISEKSVEWVEICSVRFFVVMIDLENEKVISLRENKCTLCFQMKWSDVWKVNNRASDWRVRCDWGWLHGTDEYDAREAFLGFIPSMGVVYSSVGQSGARSWPGDRPISGQAVGGFLRVLRFASPPSGTFKIKKPIPNYVIAELALRTTWLWLCWCQCVSECVRSPWVCVLRQIAALAAIVTMGTAPIKVLHRRSSSSSSSSPFWLLTRHVASKTISASA